MVRIRLTRTGLKKQPSYRVVVAEKESKRDGKYIELIGHYNPRTDPLVFKIQEDRALYWLSVGAQASDAVRRLLEKQGTYARLARFHGGEPLDVLVAEYEGKPVAVAAPVAEAKPTILAKVAEVVAEVVEDVKEAAGAVVEAVSGTDEATEEDVSEEVTTEVAGEATEESSEEAANA
jgi:small subunit ribosomal protein S16